MKIMTFNIQSCRDYKKRLEGAGDSINQSLMASVIRAQRADICGLNEVRDGGLRADYTHQPSEIADCLGYNSAFGLAALIHGDNRYGNALVSRYAITKTEVFPIPKTQGEPRSVLRCELDTGKRLAVYQTHFGLSRTELETAAEFVCELFKKESLPAVLMGDFNMEPDDRLLERFQNEPGFVSTDRMLEGIKTFPSDIPDIKIDYIFTNSGVKVFSAYVPEVVASDHRPLCAEIEF